MKPLTTKSLRLESGSKFEFDPNDWLADEIQLDDDPWVAKAYLALLCRSWRQVPIASLPDSDAVLSVWSGAGAHWPIIAERVKAKFEPCADGRLYHWALAQEANRLWERQQKRAHLREQARLRKARQRAREAAESSPERVTRDIAVTPEKTQENQEHKERDISVTQPPAAAFPGVFSCLEAFATEPPPPLPVPLMSPLRVFPDPFPIPPLNPPTLSPALGELTLTCPSNRSDLDSAVELWNELASKSQLPKVMRLHDKRRRALAARLKDLGGIEGWRGMIEKIQQSDFLMDGSPNSDWRCNFDFVLSEKNLTKIMEGFYDYRESKSALRRVFDRYDRSPEPIEEGDIPF